MSIERPMVKSQIENRKSPIRLTDLQLLLLRVANKRGSVRVRSSDRRRRSAVERLRGLELIAWDAHLHAWILTDAGRAQVASVGGKIHDVTPEMEYSDFVRAN
jgi:hypothetical protein